MVFAKEGVMNMVDVYNLYLGGYLPKVSPKSNVHNRRELKNKYKSIVKLNNANPLAMVKLSNATQAYALDVKEMSMELAEAARNALTGEGDDRENLQKMTDIYNRLLKRSDEFGKMNDRPSRPGGELRHLVMENDGELENAGFVVDEMSFLKMPKSDDDLKVPEGFVNQLLDKCEYMSMNPMEYVERKVYSYSHLYHNDISPAYETSLYSGMLFNSYC